MSEVTFWLPKWDLQLQWSLATLLDNIFGRDFFYSKGLGQEIHVGNFKIALRSEKVSETTNIPLSRFSKKPRTPLHLNSPTPIFYGSYLEDEKKLVGVLKKIKCTFASVQHISRRVHNSSGARRNRISNPPSDFRRGSTFAVKCISMIACLKDF